MPRTRSVTKKNCEAAMALSRKRAKERQDLECSSSDNSDFAGFEDCVMDEMDSQPQDHTKETEAALDVEFVEAAINNPTENPELNDDLNANTVQIRQIEDPLEPEINQQHEIPEAVLEEADVEGNGEQNQPIPIQKKKYKAIPP